MKEKNHYRRPDGEVFHSWSNGYRPPFWPSESTWGTIRLVVGIVAAAVALFCLLMLSNVY